ncbi:hypothetical protein [Sphingobium subterraneum]|uniref:Uncharacterized protein n=1 Tax=Sphingobium subterraneum TaxID=627688 RepID=A0A841J405_9SPHN|nr:hypothetical protein [Sphingobium subterraneum]MBB6125440.1 hypothetical protein [Sphingobium subterraneum]
MDCWFFQDRGSGLQCQSLGAAAAIYASQATANYRWFEQEDLPTGVGVVMLLPGGFSANPRGIIMARKGSLEAERQAIARERNALEAREAKLRESEQHAMAELLRKSALGKAPFERVEGFFAALGKLGLAEAEKRLAKS